MFCIECVVHVLHDVTLRLIALFIECVAHILNDVTSRFAWHFEALQNMNIHIY